jgi:putative ABC transport system permease protein
MPDVWMPFTIDRANLAPGRHAHFAIARVKPEVSFERAGADLQAIAARIAEESPVTNTGVGARIVPIHGQAVETIKPALLVLLAAVGSVLLIACTNVANLLLARAGTRRREVAIRVAVGAGRGRLVRQLMTESLLLAAVGGVCGLALALWGSRVLVAINPIDLPRVFATGVDFRVLGFTGGVTILTGLAFGLVPALETSKTNLQTVLSAGSRSSGSRAQMRLKSVLVVGQMALALALLIGAGLMIKSFSQLRNVDPGFAAENLLTFGLMLPESRYTEVSEYRRYFDGIIERLEPRSKQGECLRRVMLRRHRVWQ